MLLSTAWEVFFFGSLAISWKMLLRAFGMVCPVQLLRLLTPARATTWTRAYVLLSGVNHDLYAYELWIHRESYPVYTIIVDVAVLSDWCLWCLIAISEAFTQATRSSVEGISLPCSCQKVKKEARLQNFLRPRGISLSALGILASLSEGGFGCHKYSIVVNLHEELSMMVTRTFQVRLLKICETSSDVVWHVTNSIVGREQLIHSIFPRDILRRLMTSFVCLYWSFKLDYWWSRAGIRFVLVVHIVVIQA